MAAQVVDLVEGSEGLSAQVVDLIEGSEVSSVQVVDLIEGSEVSFVQVVDLIEGSEVSSAQVVDLRCRPLRWLRNTHGLRGGQGSGRFDNHHRRHRRSDDGCDNHSFLLGEIL
ncbi:hypothetical protein TNCV_4515441 [Trichonephila clavipes]|nr:hypothetical protein TNCV_4515441 [Trichonephila clavipes]